MENRTEEEKITQAGIEVTLGGKEYKIAPLVIKYSGEWRKKSVPLIAYLSAYSKQKDIAGAVTELFTNKTDEILDSFFEYARDLDREEIEGIATDGEIILAFIEVFNAFVSPLAFATPKKAKKSSQ